MNKDEYNALLHAMWRLDELIKGASLDPLTAKNLEVLQRDRQALGGLFVRL